MRITRLLRTLDWLIVAGAAAVPVVWLLGAVQFRISSEMILPIGWRKIAAVVILALIARVVIAVVAREVPKPRVVPHGMPARLLLALTSVFLSMGVVEWAMTVTDWDIRLAPIVVRGSEGAPRKVGWGLISDPELRWRFKPGQDIWSIKINKMGYRDREVSSQKEPGKMRVICIGDSCVAAGEPPFSWILHDALTNAPWAGPSWEAFNMGVYGYSSRQGLCDFRIRGRQLEPSIVTVYYGWNDHWWSGICMPDSIAMAETAGTWKQAVVERLGRRHLGRLIVSSVGLVPGTRRVDGKDCLRVAPEEYVDNLEALVGEIRSAGAIPILMTAPRAETLASNLVTDGTITSMESGLKLHDQYVALTREVAARTHSPLIDLAEKYNGQENFFRADGIHPSQEGSALIADDLYREIKSLVLPVDGGESALVESAKAADAAQED